MGSGKEDPGEPRQSTHSPALHRRAVSYSRGHTVHAKTLTSQRGCQQGAL